MTTRTFRTPQHLTWLNRAVAQKWHLKLLDPQALRHSSWETLMRCSKNRAVLSRELLTLAPARGSRTSKLSSRSSPALFQRKAGDMFYNMCRTRAFWWPHNEHQDTDMAVDTAKRTRKCLRLTLHPDKMTLDVKKDVRVIAM